MTTLASKDAIALSDRNPSERGHDVVIIGLAGLQLQDCIRALDLDLKKSIALIESLRAVQDPAHGHNTGNGGADPVIARVYEELQLLQILPGIHPQLKIIAFYMSPWEAFLERCMQDGEQSREQAASWIQAWFDYHQQLMATRKQVPGRMVLLNAGRLGDIERIRSQLLDAGVPLHEPSRPVEIDRCRPVQTLLFRLLASQMGELGREYWELYETLESCALLCGREPEFQGAMELIDTQDLNAILACFSQIQSAIDAETIYDRRATPRGVQGDPGHLHLLDQVQRENELLGLQLHQLYEELDYHVAYNARLRGLVSYAGEGSEAARQLISELTTSKTDPPVA